MIYRESDKTIKSILIIKIKCIQIIILLFQFFPETERPNNPCLNCGSNTQCTNGACACSPNYHGDPYIGCRPECVMNSDCPRNQACINLKCTNPCTNVCGENAQCTVPNHLPICTCFEGMAGNAFVACYPTRKHIFFLSTSISFYTDSKSIINNRYICSSTRNKRSM